jgi:hypothetical protein
MSAITLHIGHVGPINQRKEALIKAATQLLKEIISKEPQTELIIVEEKGGKEYSSKKNLQQTGN